MSKRLSDKRWQFCLFENLEDPGVIDTRDMHRQNRSMENRNHVLRMQNAPKRSFPSSKMFTDMCLVETHRKAGWIHHHGVQMEAKADRSGDDLASRSYTGSMGVIHRVISR